MPVLLEPGIHQAIQDSGLFADCKSLRVSVDADVDTTIFKEQVEELAMQIAVRLPVERLTGMRLSQRGLA